VLLKHRQQREYLIAAERPLVLAHHHGVETPIRVSQRSQQRRPRPLSPRQPPTSVDVEELHDHPAVTLDQILDHIPLPLTRRRRFLKLSRRHPPIEGGRSPPDRAYADEIVYSTPAPSIHPKSPPVGPHTACESCDTAAQQFALSGQ